MRINPYHAVSIGLCSSFCLLIFGMLGLSFSWKAAFGLVIMIGVIFFIIAFIIGAIELFSYLDRKAAIWDFKNQK